jgi:indolepyruvate ferredoxin oxidoreductase beta subunit
MRDWNILIAGVGGQGTLLACRILGNAGLAAGFDVKASEVHGMAQRGGSVVTHVRMGRRVSSPLVEKGEADLVLGFEPLETARWIEYLKTGGRVITGSARVNPMPVVTGQAAYPEGLSEICAERCGDVVAVDAGKIAREAGNAKAANLVLIGAAAAGSEIPKETWIDAIRATVPARSLETNLKAFEAGYGIRKGGNA